MIIYIFKILKRVLKLETMVLIWPLFLSFLTVILKRKEKEKRRQLAEVEFMKDARFSNKKKKKKKKSNKLLGLDN